MNRPKSLPILFPAFLFLSALSTRTSASPFTIDGSTVYVNGGFVGIRTSTPATVLDVNGDAQFGSGSTKSTFTATGLLKLTSSGIQWADGTTSTSGSYQESCVDLTGVVGAGGDNLRIGIAGSTMTITTTASTTTVHWMASVADNSGGCVNSNQMAISFLVDGAFVSPMTATIACTAGGVMGNSGGCAALYCRWPMVLSAGSHSFAATWDNVSGGNSDTPKCGGSATCRFCVETR